MHSRSRRRKCHSDFVHWPRRQSVVVLDASNCNSSWSFRPYRYLRLEGWKVRLQRFLFGATQSSRGRQALANADTRKLEERGVWNSQDRAGGDRQRRRIRDRAAEGLLVTGYLGQSTPQLNHVEMMGPCHRQDFVGPQGSDGKSRTVCASEFLRWDQYVYWGFAFRLDSPVTC